MKKTKKKSKAEKPHEQQQTAGPAVHGLVFVHDESKSKLVLAAERLERSQELHEAAAKQEHEAERYLRRAREHYEIAQAVTRRTGGNVQADRDALAKMVC